MGSLLVERYERSTTNAAGVVLNITGGTYGKIVEDGANALPVNYNVSGATIKAATAEELRQAVSMAPASGSITVEMTADIATSFDLGNSAGTAPQNLVLDLGGKVLTLVEAVGSDGTKSSGIRVLANSALTISNGEIRCSSDVEDNIKVGIANYGTLELDGVKLYPGALTMYGVNNRGSLTLTGNTEIHNGNGEKFVAAVTNDPYEYVYSNFPAEFTAGDGVFVGSLLVERYPRNTTNAAGVVLNITGGTYGSLSDDGQTDRAADYNITGGTFGNNIDAFLDPADYECVETADGFVVTFIKKEQTGFAFAQTGTIELTYEENLTFENAAAGGTVADSTVSYAIVEEGSTPGAASVDPATGVVTVLKAGTVIIKATKAGNDTYLDAVAQYELKIAPAERSASFGQSYVDVIYGTRSYAENALSISAQSNGTQVVYSIVSGGDIASVDSQTGKLTFADQKVGTVVVKAVVSGDDCYADCEATYTVSVNWLTLPANVGWTVTGETGTNGWYKGNVTLTAPEGYTIGTSNSLDSQDWADTKTFTAEGITELDLYLKNEQGQITDAMPFQVKIDKTPATVQIEYVKDDNSNFFDWLGNTIFGSNKEVKIVFHVTGDDIALLEWSKDGGDTYEPLQAEDGIYSVTVATEYRDYVRGRVTDKAGWVMKTKEDGTLVLVDQITPELSVNFREGENGEADPGFPRDDGGFMNSAANAFYLDFVFTDNNFDLATITVNIERANGENQEEVQLNWVTAKDGNSATATLALTERDEYVITAEFRDLVNSAYRTYMVRLYNGEPELKAESLSSEQIVNTIEGVDYYKNEDGVQVQLSIADDFFIEGESGVIVNGERQVIPFKDWTWNAGIGAYTTVLRYTEEGAYEVQAFYSTTWNGEKTSEKYSFVLDTTAPNVPSLEYKEITAWEQFLEDWFGFHNDNLTVSVKGVEDHLAGVGLVEFSLDGGKTYETVNASEDGYVFTVKPDYRGKITVKVTDNADNSVTYSESRFVVLDTTVPEIEASFGGMTIDKEDPVLDAITSDPNFSVIFKIVEDNLDVAPELPKVYYKPLSGGEWVLANVTYSEDNHTVEFPMTVQNGITDGAYEVKIVVKDHFSTVEKTVEVKIDRTAPDITAQMKDPNNSKDGVAYYNDTELNLDLAITEENFDARNVTVKVLHNGELLESYSSYAQNNTNWTKTPSRVNTTSLIFTEEGVYEVTITCTDTLGTIAKPNGTDSSNIVRKFVIDRTAPEASITYNQEIDWIELLMGVFGFGEDVITANLNASDALAGVHQVLYSLDGENFVEALKDGNKYYCTVEEREMLTLQVFDLAGNDTIVREKGALVVDKVTPSFTHITTEGSFNPVKDTQNPEKKIWYTNNDPFTFTLKVTDEDTYDLFQGAAIVTDNDSVMDLEWTNTEQEGTAVIPVAGEGQHILSAEILTGARQDSWTQTVIVDTTAPVIDIAFSNAELVQPINGYDYYGTVPTLTVTINEVNFNAANVVLEMTTDRVALDEDGNPVELPNYAEYAKNPANWTIEQGTNKHVLTLDVSTDAVYGLTVNYTDLATNPAETKTASFVVDTVNPTVDTVTYSKDAVEKILEEISFGFFKADVTVQVEASDHTAGVQSVDYWIEGTVAKDDDTPVQESGTLTVNENGELETFTLPADFYGKVYTQAKDYSGHLSEKTNVAADADDDGNLIETVVVDAVAPVLTAKLSGPANTVKIDETTEVLYYNKPASLTLTVEEDNFYEELFKTTVDVASQNYEGEDAPYSGTEWMGKNQTVTMNKDAEYVVTVTGEDYSGNMMETYTTPTLIVDTIAPVIDVKLYAINEQGECDMTQEAVGETYEDDPTTYYDSAIRAVITITERNFNAEQVEWTISGVDPLGNVLTFAPTVNSEGDVHTYVVDFSVDGKYVLDVAYTDLATNPGNDVAEMIFDVDNANPDILVEGIVDGSFNKEAQTATIKITDANFVPDAEHLSYAITAVNSAGEDVEVAFPDLHDINNWTKTIVDDKVQWSITLDFAVEANYTISLSYTDLSGRVGYVHDTTGTDNPLTEYAAAFTVDNTVPEGLDIEYASYEGTSDDENTYYYKDSAILTLTAMDGIAGLDYFLLDVTQEGLTAATTIKLPAREDKIIDANSELADFVLKSVENADGKMVVALQIPANFNGKIGFRAVDKAGNLLDYAAEKSIVVDNVAPVLKTETTPIQILDAEQKTVAMPEDGNAAYMEDVVLYYADQAKFTFTLTEANFIHTDVVFTFTVNGNAQALTWTAAEDSEVYQATWTSPADGDYELHLSYTDRSGNETVVYDSQRIVVDSVAPVMNVTFSAAEPAKVTDGRDYYNAVRYATITIKDENFRPADVEITVEAKDVTGAIVGSLPAEYVNRGKSQNAAGAADEQKWSAYTGNWRREDDTYTIVIPFTTDANYTFSVSYKDLVLKEAEAFTAKPFTVDQTNPVNLTMTYAVNPIETIIDTITFGYYDAQLDVTITAEDATSGIDYFVYSYINREGVSSVNAELLNERLAVAEYSNDGGKATSRFTIPQSALGRNNQFNGRVEFDAFDRSTNKSHHNGTMGVVVDNISPTATVTFNEPVQTVNGTEYYNGAINGRIVINEANFFSSDVQVVITRDGVRYDARVTWKNNSVDEHVGTFTLDQEGDYIVTINYTDKSDNKMAEYKSATKVIDLAAPTIHLSNVVADSANDDEVYSFTITVEDADGNLRPEDINPSLSGVFRNPDGTHVTEPIDLGKATVVASGKTFTYTVQDLPKDGIYTLTCSAVDLARNSTNDIILDDDTAHATVQFSINRNGSTFDYGDEATRTLAKNYFVQSVGHDLVIHEVNVDPIYTYTVTLNGVKLTEGEDYTTTLTGGNGKWSLREYVIKGSLFAEEGEYSVVLSSVDATNTTAYSDMRNLNMSFVVDATEPAIIIGGLQNEGRYQTENQLVTMYPSDEGGSLNSVKVVLYKYNDTPGVDQPAGILFEMSGEELHDYLLANGGKIEFEVPEGYRQSVQIVCTDYSVDAEGNVNTYTQTLKDITVSPSGFMMFYADKPVFYGTICGISAILALIIFLVVRKKKKKEETPAA